MPIRRLERDSLELRPHELQAISAPLLSWFDVNQRPMPWRESRNPYRVWVSEVMLQQTQVGTVIPYFERFMARFPTVLQLALAPQDDVLKHWEGLGYYSRARNLQATAKILVREHEGVFPRDYAKIRALPGIGDYTAGAIASIAFNQPRPAVDGNVFRVLARLFLMDDDIMRPSSRPRFEELARRLIPEGEAGRFNQALMELGATRCTPSHPRCDACPVAASCRVRETGRWSEFPFKTKKASPRDIAFAVAVVEARGRYLLVRRPNKGLLGGLWEFPTFEMKGGDAMTVGASALLETYAFAISHACPLASVPHRFTHLRAVFHAFRTQVRDGERLPGESDDVRWCSLSEVDAFAMPLAQQKIAQALKRSQSPPRPPSPGSTFAEESG